MTQNRLDDDRTEANSYTVHYIAESDARRALKRFKAKAEAVEAGEYPAVSDTVHVKDSMFDELTDVMILIDGEPLDSWINGRVDRMKVTADDEQIMTDGAGAAGLGAPDTCPLHDVDLEDAGDDRLRCPESETETTPKGWALLTADFAIPSDALEARVVLSVPEDVYQVARAKADTTGEAIGEHLMGYLNLRCTWIREETGTVIHEDGGQA
jgi:hypothetical protein